MDPKFRLSRTALYQALCSSQLAGEEEQASVDWIEKITLRIWNCSEPKLSVMQVRCLDGEGGGGVRAKVRQLNTSAVPSLGNLTTNFAPCYRHLNLTVQSTGC